MAFGSVIILIEVALVSSCKRQTKPTDCSANYAAWKLLVKSAIEDDQEARVRLQIHLANHYKPSFTLSIAVIFLTKTEH